MNYGEIKHNLISLVFGETSDLDEVEELGSLYDSINRAMSEINVDFPYIATYQFEIDQEDVDEGELIRVDMTDTTKVTGFLDFDETPLLYEKDGKGTFKRFSDYEIEKEVILVIDPAGHIGKYRVYYRCEPTHVGSTTVDTAVPEIPLKAHYLIPILSAYWLWLDDDEQKAVQYRNLYETERERLRARTENTKAKIHADPEWGVI